MSNVGTRVEIIIRFRGKYFWSLFYTNSLDNGCALQDLKATAVVIQEPTMSYNYSSLGL
jgi:hypothetical protein